MSSCLQAGSSQPENKERIVVSKWMQWLIPLNCHLKRILATGENRLLTKVVIEAHHIVVHVAAMMPTKVGRHQVAYAFPIQLALWAQAVLWLVYDMILLSKAALRLTQVWFSSSSMTTNIDIGEKLQYQSDWNNGLLATVPLNSQTYAMHFCWPFLWCRWNLSGWLHLWLRQ